MYKIARMSHTRKYWSRMWAVHVGARKHTFKHRHIVLQKTKDVVCGHEHMVLDVNDGLSGHMHIHASGVH